MTASTRLTLALSTSAFVLSALAPLAFVPALLAPIPLLVALRCLPIGIAIPLALGVPALGRLCALGLFAGAASLEAEGGAGARFAVLASVIGLVPLLCDRLAAVWLRRVGFLAFPCAVIVVAWAAERFHAPAAVVAWLSPPRTPLFDVWGQTLTATGVAFYVAALASVLAGLAAVRLWQVPDPYAQREREHGLRFGGIAAVFSFITVAGGGGLRVWAGHPTDGGSPSDAWVFLCTAGLVALLAAAVSARGRWAASSSPALASPSSPPSSSLVL